MKTRSDRWRCDLGIATDGDADRLGVIDDQGQFVHPNKLLVLLYYYLVKYRGWQGPCVRNNSTTVLLYRVAAGLGQNCYEVPVGFKWVSAKMTETDAKRFCNGLLRGIPKAVSDVIARRDEIKRIADCIKHAKDVYFIGRGIYGYISRRIAIDKAAVDVCRYFNPEVKKVVAYLGWEQEYFLVDEGL